MTQSRYYLDHAATTPMLHCARDAMAEEFSVWANPSSPHGFGRVARRRLEDARAAIKAALDWDDEVIFTSGASEAIAIAMRAQVTHRLIGALEHDAVLRCRRDGDATIPALSNGQVNVVALGAQLAALSGGTRAVVTVQQVNNETGVIQPTADIAAVARSAGALFFCDAAQGAGKMPLPDADLISLSAHKFGGPPGIGALLVRGLGTLTPTGGQEQGYRGGTENVPAIVAMAAALDAPRDWLGTAKVLRARLDDGARALGLEVIANTAERLPTIASYRLPGVKAASQLVRFDMAGIAVSAGSACSSGTLKTSHVLTAMGMDADAAGEVVRLSFGPDTDASAVDAALSVWRAIVA
jgi:cysteine desulfurase